MWTGIQALNNYNGQSRCEPSSEKPSWFGPLTYSDLVLLHCFQALSNFFFNMCFSFLFVCILLDCYIFSLSAVYILLYYPGKICVWCYYGQAVQLHGVLVHDSNCALDNSKRSHNKAWEKDRLEWQRERDISLAYCKVLHNKAASITVEWFSLTLWQQNINQEFYSLYCFCCELIRWL